MSKLNLNLSKAKESSFDAIPSGTYDAVVFEADMRQTKGGEGAKLPEGTDMLNLQFKITDGEYENRRFFRSYPIAPDGYEKKDVMDGILFGVLKAIGAMEEPGKLNIDLDELAGLPCRIVLGQKDYKGEMQNEVKRVKPAGSDTEFSDLP
jgi:hypothetical protein